MLKSKTSSDLRHKNIKNIFQKIKNYTNKWIIETYNMNIKDYKDSKEYKAIQRIIKKNWLEKFSDCSEEIQDAIKIVYWMEETEKIFIHKERKNFLKCLKKIRLIWAIKSAYSILCLFFTKEKNHRRIINIWKNISYEWFDKDEKYLESKIKQISNPEKKSIIVYLIWKIKDKKMKKRLKKLWKDANQFDLLLQQCKKWQIMLTNALNPDGSSSLFKELTQAVSWSRWCHCLIISDIIKDKRWIIKDLKIIQSTLNWWVHETTFRKYIKENYSESDFLLASFPKNKKNPIILNAKNHIWQKYDRIAMILDIITWWDFKYLWKEIKDVNKTYCTALIFDAIKKSDYNIPKSHLTPADILSIENLHPEYACYCDNLQKISCKNNQKK